MSPIKYIALALALAACVPGSRGQQQQADLDEDGAVSFTEVRRLLMKGRPDLSDFSQLGPVAYDVRENRALKAGDDTIVFDEATPDSASPTPLVIIVHGNHSRKEAHRYQAERLASFGIHALVLQVPNYSQWMKNGRRVKAFVERIHDAPGLLKGDVDPEKIILVGHSFGGSAVTIAAGRGAPVKGLILLDPAVVSRHVQKYMPRVGAPVMLLGADKEVFRSRQRRLFFRGVAGEVGEVSVRGATHDDAQNPSMYSLSAFGFDPFTSRDKQEVFTAALVATAFSLGATGKLDFAWQAMEEPLEKGVLKNPRRRAAR